MLESKDIFILGYSGHSYVVIDVVLSNDYIIKGYFDFKKAKKNPYNLIYYGNEGECDLEKILNGNFIFPAIGSNIIRRKLFELIENKNLSQITLVDRSACVSSQANLGKSTLVCPKGIINSRAIIGNACIINSGVIIEHECEVGDFSHIAPGAVLTGNIKVGKNVFIGANAVIKQGIIIGDNVVVGAGSVVLKNIPDGETWVGNPAKKIR